MRVEALALSGAGWQPAPAPEGAPFTAAVSCKRGSLADCQSAAAYQAAPQRSPPPLLLRPDFTETPIEEAPQQIGPSGMRGPCTMATGWTAPEDRKGPGSAASRYPRRAPPGNGARRCPTDV